MTSRPVILITEDEPYLRKILTSQLEEAGFRVVPARDGTHTMQLATQSPPDLVLTDLRMPDLDGLDLIAWLRGQLPDCPIVVLSIVATARERIAALERGANDYLTKPWDREEMLVRLRNLIEWRRPLHAAGRAPRPSA